MLKKVLVLVSMAAVVALLVAGLSGFGAQDTSQVYASRLAKIDGAGITGINVQNLDQAASANITADFYPQTEGEKKSFPATAGPGAAANYYLPSLGGLADGAYAAIVNSDRQIAAIARTEWALSKAAGTYSNVIPGTEVSLPLLTKNYKGQCSLVSIQNTNTGGPGTATVEIYQVGQSTAAKTVEYTIKAGSSTTLQMCTGKDFETLPDEFLGSMRVVSKDGTTKFGVQSFVDLTGAGQEKAVYAFEGVPSDQASDTLYAPLFRKKQDLGGGKTGTTGIAVSNTQATPVTVTVEYYPVATAACTDATMRSESKEIAASSSYVFYSGVAPVPSKCYGSAKISAPGGKILAIVNDSVDITGQGIYNSESAAYNAVTADQAGLMVALPLFRSKHTNSELVTGISAMNVGTGAANIKLVAKSNSGVTLQDKPGMTQSGVQPNVTVVFWPPLFTKTEGAPWNSMRDAFGSATIESDQPVVVIVNDTAQTKDATKLQDAATYLGIKIGQ